MPDCKCKNDENILWAKTFASLAKRWNVDCAWLLVPDVPVIALIELTSTEAIGEELS